jgi:hypothetical protein
MRFNQYLFIVFLLGFLSMNAQVITNYSFTSTTNTFTPISNGVTPALSGGDFDEGWYNSIPIGFEFWYMGNLISNIHASTNGLLSLNQNVSASGAAANNNLGAFVSGIQRPFIAPLWDNLDMDSTTGARFSYATTGVAPNRVFVAEWLNAEWNWFANSSTISFQVRLYETSGIVEFIYRQEPGSIFSPSASIGITGSTTTSFLSLNNSGASPSVSSSVATNNINAKPQTGQSYLFTPPIPADPTSANIGNIAPTSFTVTWTAVTGVTRYAVYKSTDNVNFEFAGTSATTALNVNALIPSTTYYIKVFSISEGALSNNPAQANATTASGALSGTIQVPSASFATITSVLDSIKVVGIGGHIIIELQNNYTSVGERFPMLFTDTLGTSANATITIRPAVGATGLEIIPTVNFWSTLYFNKGKHIIIDGRPGGVGNNRELTIRTSSSASAIELLVGGNSFNTFTHLNLRASVGVNQVFAYYEMINNSGLPNTNNIVRNCIIGDSVATSIYPIYATSNFVNGAANNTFENNYIINASANSTINYGMFFNSNAAHTWYIRGNHIFSINSLGGVSTSYTFTGIQLNTGNYYVNNNFIGGTDTACGGFPLEVGPASANNNFFGISYIGGSGQFASIQGNKIANVFWPGVSLTPWIGINTAGGAAVYIGDTLANTIGEPSASTPSVYVLSQTTNNPVAIGIRTNTSGLTRVSKNVISGIQATGVNSSFPCSFVGIQSNNSNNVEISNNTVGSTQFINAIRSASTNSTQAQFVSGIQVNFTGTGVLNVLNNTIANLSNAGTSTSTQNYTNGIAINSNANVLVNNNTISRLFNAGGNPSGNGLTAISGIYYTSSSGFANISNNEVHTLKAASISAPNYVYGINVASTSGTTTIVNANRIHSMAVASNSLLASIVGINVQDGNQNITNNMIRLGIDENGAPLTGSNVYIGIHKVSSYSVLVYHNSVYIGGTVAGTNLISTYAFKKTIDGYDDIRNNIFSNVRTNASTGGRHFAMGFNSVNNVISNGNLVFAPGNNGRLYQLVNTDYNSRWAWYTATNLDDKSDSADAAFINPIGTASTVDLHINPGTPTKVEANGIATPVTVDFDGQTRSNFTPVDIGADAGNFLRVPILILPVEFVQLSGKKLNDDAQIDWTINGAKNVFAYEVERSNDGVHFSTVYVMRHSSGSSNQRFSFVDYGVFMDQHTVHYRIKIVDFDARISYSVIVTLTKDEQAEIKLWPNPAQTNIQLQIPAHLLNANLVLTDVTGRIHYSNNALKNLQTIDVADLNAGIYLLQLMDGNGVKYSQRIVIHH